MTDRMVMDGVGREVHESGWLCAPAMVMGGELPLSASQSVSGNVDESQPVWHGGESELC